MLWICSTAVPAKAQLSFVVIGANCTPLPVDLQQQGASSMAPISREIGVMLVACLDKDEVFVLSPVAEVKGRTVA